MSCEDVRSHPQEEKAKGNEWILDVSGHSQDTGHASDSLGSLGWE